MASSPSVSMNSETMKPASMARMAGGLKSRSLYVFIDRMASETYEDCITTSGPAALRVWTSLVMSVVPASYGMLATTSYSCSLAYRSSRVATSVPQRVFSLRIATLFTSMPLSLTESRNS